MTQETSFSNLIRELEEIASWGYPEIASHLPSGRIPIGYFCPYVPEELLQACGAVPIRLMDMPVKISHAQAHLSAYCCHLVKSSLENYLRGNLDFLKGIVFSQSCDSMKGLAEIWALEGVLPSNSTSWSQPASIPPWPGIILRPRWKGLKPFWKKR